ncbi:MAG TPA: DUF4160 domain-containing protein [Candidatus Elarobacter sp.]|jgi:hypothetical protein
MPAVLRIRGMRFYIYVGDEHEPAHVHVKWSECEVIVILDESNGRGRVREIVGPVHGSDLARIHIVVAEYFDTLMATWSAYHR